MPKGARLICFIYSEAARATYLHPNFDRRGAPAVLLGGPRPPPAVPECHRAGTSTSSKTALSREPHSQFEPRLSRRISRACVRAESSWRTRSMRRRSNCRTRLTSMPGQLSVNQWQAAPRVSARLCFRHLSPRFESRAETPSSQPTGCLPDRFALCQEWWAQLPTMRTRPSRYTRPRSAGVWAASPGSDHDRRQRKEGGVLEQV